jgi:hypothetical protein
MTAEFDDKFNKFKEYQENLEAVNQQLQEESTQNQELVKILEIKTQSMEEQLGV